MTSGLPPGAAEPRRAGAFVPPAVAPVLSLPVWLVFVGTVLLSMLRRCGLMRLPILGLLGTRCRRAAPDARSRRASPRHAPLAGHGKPLQGQGADGDPPLACRHGDQREWCRGVPAARKGAPAKGSVR